MRKFLIAAFLVALLVPALVQGTPIIGQVNIGGNVEVTYTTIDWSPYGGPSGTFGVLGGNSGYFASLTPNWPLPPYDQGTILDLSILLQPVGVPISVPNFIVFTTNLTGVSFELQFIYQGTYAPGSPFTFSYDGQSTTVSMSMRGVVTDSSDPTAEGFWLGSWSADFTGLSPAQVLALLQNPGYVRAPYSAQIAATAIPEPATAGLIGLGLIAAGFLRRRR